MRFTCFSSYRILLLFSGYYDRREIEIHIPYTHISRKTPIYPARHTPCKSKILEIAR